MTPLLEGDQDAAGSMQSAAASLDKKLIDLEDHLIQRRLTGRAQDGVRWPSKLVSRITYLANGLASNDFPPTAQQREVHAQFKQQIAAAKMRLDELVSKDLTSFNQVLQERKIQNVIARVPS